MVLTFGSKNSFILPLTLKSCDLDFGIRHMKLRRRLGQHLITRSFIIYYELYTAPCGLQQHHLQSGQGSCLFQEADMFTLTFIDWCIVNSFTFVYIRCVLVCICVSFYSNTGTYCTREPGCIQTPQWCSTCRGKLNLHIHHRARLPSAAGSGRVYIKLV